MQKEKILSIKLTELHILSLSLCVRCGQNTGFPVGSVFYRLLAGNEHGFLNSLHSLPTL